MAGVVDASERTILITGATSGIGRAAAHELAARGARLVLVGRDPARTEAVRREIVAASGNREVTSLLADLSSQEQVRALADGFLASGRPLHVLVNNAGAMYVKRQETVDGVEMTLAVNYLAGFLLTHQLLPRLRESGDARVVNVASDNYADVGHRLDFENLELRRRYGALKAYAISKLALILFTGELARRLGETDVTANSLHPGLVASNFARNNGWLYGLGMTLMKPFVRSTRRGAETVVHLSVSPDVARTSGAYFEDCAPHPLKPFAEDTEDARRLWEVSCAMTGISEGDDEVGLQPTTSSG